MCGYSRRHLQLPTHSTLSPLLPFPHPPPACQADASGAVEAVRSALSGLPQDAVILRYLMAAPGDITQSDLDLAAASGGIVLGFNTPVSDTVQARLRLLMLLMLGALPVLVFFSAQPCHLLLLFLT